MKEINICDFDVEEGSCVTTGPTHMIEKVSKDPRVYSAFYNQILMNKGTELNVSKEFLFSFSIRNLCGRTAAQGTAAQGTSKGEQVKILMNKGTPQL